MTDERDHITQRPRLAADSPIPLYYQLAQIFRDWIKDGSWSPDSQIPGEAELQDMFNVSRATVRRALGILVREEMLERHRGRGTRVRRPRITRELPGLTSYSEEMTAAGHKPGSMVVTAQLLRQPEPAVKKALMHKSGEEIMYLQRLRFADSDLLGMTHCYLPMWVWERMGIAPEQLNDQSLYGYLEQRAGIELVEADETVRVLPADPEMARQIKVRQGFPIIELERIVYTQHGIPIEYALNCFRADKYQIRVHHRRVRHPHGVASTLARGVLE